MNLQAEILLQSLWAPYPLSLKAWSQQASILYGRAHRCGGQSAHPPHPCTACKHTLASAVMAVGGPLTGGILSWCCM